MSMTSEEWIEKTTRRLGKACRRATLLALKAAPSDAEAETQKQYIKMALEVVLNRALELKWIRF